VQSPHAFFQKTRFPFVARLAADAKEAAQLRHLCWCRKANFTNSKRRTTDEILSHVTGVERPKTCNPCPSALP
jgi:hypothetical protein